MRLCPCCGAQLERGGWDCEACGFEPEEEEGILRLAPHLEMEGGFESDYFEPLARLEAQSFWFRARNSIIRWALTLQGARAGSMLEIGCGTGYVLSGIRAQFPELVLTGSEVFAQGLSYARERLPDVELLQLDARALPFREHFDVVGAFDVLEHIPEDDEALLQCHKVLKPGGLLVITVPQHPLLWSDVDVLAHHQRRYRRRDLLGKLGKAGFRPHLVTSFVTLLFPLLLAARLRSRKGTCSGAELALPPCLDRVLGGVMDLELGLLRLGLRPTWGGSLLVVADRLEVPS